MLWRRVFEELGREVEEWVGELCKSGFTVVLFGSRARGTARIDSDWDLLVVGPARPEPPNDIAQVHFFPSLDEVAREVDRLNTVVVDALLEGRVLCDHHGITSLVERARHIVGGLVKTELGWVRG